MIRAIRCHDFSGIESLKMESIPLPTCTEDEVLIKVAYAGVNYPDTLLIHGKYQFTPELPFSPGQEVSGEVIEVGSHVKHVSKGDMVVAFMTWGGYAEVASVHADNVFVLPPGIALDTAAVILETYGTVIHALKDRGSLKAGETLAVLGASGGIGSAAIQLGNLFGAQTLAICSSKEKQEQAVRNGANIAIGYENLKVQLKHFNVDVIVDPVGGDDAEHAFRALRPGGSHLVIGFTSGKIPSIPFNLPLLKSASIVGVFWGSFWRSNPIANRANVNMLLKWFSQNKLHIHIGKTYELSDARKALTEMINREVIGKTVLKVS